MKYYSSIKKSKLLAHIITWVSHVNMPCDGNQTQNVAYCAPFMQNASIGKFLETGSR
jgi:hypothetical protein